MALQTSLCSLYFSAHFIPKQEYENGFNYKNTCLGENTRFYLNNPEDAVSVIWDFGDGNTSTDFNPSHVYSSSDSYLVELIITANDGIDYHFEETIYIGNGPYI